MGASAWLKANTAAPTDRVVFALEPSIDARSEVGDRPVCDRRSEGERGWHGVGNATLVMRPHFRRARETHDLRLILQRCHDTSTTMRRLVRLCVVLAVTGLSWRGLVVYSYGFECSNPHRDAERDIQRLADAARIYSLAPNRPPADLDALVRAGLIDWGSRRDPWGSEYQLHAERGRWEIRCAGPDRTHGTRDDIVARGHMCFDCPW